MTSHLPPPPPDQSDADAVAALIEGRVDPAWARWSLIALAVGVAVHCDDCIAFHVKAAVDQGLLKIISKMGISTLRSYHAAQQFEAVGLDRTVVDRYFAGSGNLRYDGPVGKIDLTLKGGVSSEIPVNASASMQLQKQVSVRVATIQSNAIVNASVSRPPGAPSACRRSNSWVTASKIAWPAMPSGASWAYS